MTAGSEARSSYNPSPQVQADIERRFTYHPPFGTQASRYESVRMMMRSAANFLTHACPESRELSLALTKLEEAVFWANASIARHESGGMGPR